MVISVDRILLTCAGLSQVGLFRVAGNRKNVDALEEALDSGNPISYSGEHAHVLCTLIKKYFRTLPTPLICMSAQSLFFFSFASRVQIFTTFVAFDKFEDFMEIMEYDEEYRIDSLKEVVEGLDPVPLALLEFLCRFLQYVFLVDVNHKTTK